MKRYIKADSSWKTYNRAANPNTPAAELANLASDEDSWVRGGVARNLSTPLNILSALANDKSSHVREQVARNPHTPQEVLARLATDSDEEVAAGVSVNPNTSLETLNRLVNGTHAYGVLYNVADHPNADSVLLDKIAQRGEGLWDTALCIARHPNVSAETLDYLAKHPSYRDGYQLYSTIIENPKTLSSTLAYIVDNDVVHVKIAREAKDPAVLDKLADVCEAYVKADIAENWYTSPETLRKISKARDEAVKLAVARNHKTPADVLLQIASSAYASNPELRNIIVKHPNATSEVLGKLSRRGTQSKRPTSPEKAYVGDAKEREKIARTTKDLDVMEVYVYDPDCNVRLALSANPNATPEILESIYNDQELRETRYSNRPLSSFKYLNTLYRNLANNYNTPPEILREISKYDKYGEDFGEDVLYNPNTPEDVLLKFIKYSRSKRGEEDLEYFRRFKIARTYNLSDAVYRALAKDARSDIRLELVKNMSVPDKIIKKLINDPDPEVREIVEERLTE